MTDKNRSMSRLRNKDELRQIDLTGKEVFNPNEAAAFLQLHVNTLLIHACNGLIPSRTVGKSRRFHRDALVRWLIEGDDEVTRRARHHRNRSSRIAKAGSEPEMETSQSA